jgi:hypothetical protein
MVVDIFIASPNYVDSLVCSITDGLLDLGHKVYIGYSTSLNYAEPSANHSGDYDLFLGMDTDNRAGRYMTLYKKDFSVVPKVMIHGHDMWTDYINVPNSPEKKIPFDGNYDICFVRDLRKPFPLDKRIHAIDYAIEKRYVEACLGSSHSPFMNREWDVVFFGTLTTARRQFYLDKLKTVGVNVRYGKYDFNTPDGKWSQHIYGRYTHDNDYYKELTRAKFSFCGMGAGPSTMRTAESYAAGCIPLIQRYPEEIIPYHNFVDQENCILWGDEKELVEKVKYYIDRPEEAEKLRQRCYNYGQESMLSKHLAQYILDRVPWSNNVQPI